jgi:5-methylcytosine-specific restriction protein A
MGDPFYRSVEWRRFRLWFLRHHPSCAVAGCRTLPTHVDHVKARRAGGADFDPLNCQALCSSHHSQKTAWHDRPTFKRSNNELRASGTDNEGNPIDPKHPWNLR